MSLWKKIETALSSGYAHVKSWIAPEVDAAEELYDELKSEAERIGPQLIYDACAAALASVSGGSIMNTGTLIRVAADVAINKLKAEGKQDVTAAVFGSVAAALLKMHSTAAAQGLTQAGATPPAA